MPGVTPPQLSRFTVDGFFTLDAGLHYLEHGNIYQMGDSVSWFRGRHSVKFGGEFQRSQMINRASTATNGFFRFDGSDHHNAFADLLIGKPLNLDQSSPYDRGVQGYNWFAFVQDNWRISQRVTLNLDFVISSSGRSISSTIGPTRTARAANQRCTPTAPLGMLFPGDEGIGRGLVRSDKNNSLPG